MKRNFLKFGSLCLMVTAAVMTGCIDQDKDLFDEDGAKKIYKDGFPVENVDASHDWKTTRTATVNVTVNEDKSDYTDYTIQLFTDNPLNAKSGARLLATGYATQNTDYTFSTTVDYPNANSTLYAARIDERGRYAVKPVEVKNGNLTASFGNVVATRANGTVEITDINDIKTIVTKEEVENMLAQATAITGGLWSTTNGAILKVVQNLSFTGSGQFNLASNSNFTIIIKNAKLSLGSTGQSWDSIIFGNGAAANVHIIVAEGGELEIPAGQLTLYGSVTIMEGGKVSGDGTFMLEGNNAVVYNAGTCQLKHLNLTTGNGLTIYNDGIMTADTYTASHANTKFINRGSATFKNFNGNTNSVLENGCYLKVEQSLAARHILLADNGSIYCNDFADDGTGVASLTMGSPSMLVCETYYDVNRNVTGPADGSALIKAETISRPNGTWTGSYAITGNVIIELPESTYNENAYPFLEGFIAAGGSQASICLPGQANFTMTPSDCAGDGYEGNGEGPGPIDPEEIAYTYVYEDNFPQLGDYDFNDVVLNVVPVYNRNANNNVESIDLKVILSAVGATKKLAAALRLPAAQSAYITNVTYSGDDKDDFLNTLSGSALNSTAAKNAKGEWVIPLFGDAHKVYGLNERKMINTNLGGNNGGTSRTYTMTITLTPVVAAASSPVGLDQYDFFIAYEGGNDSVTEVHLYEFWSMAAATEKGNIHEQNQQAAGNRTWAVCVPDFRFPIEACKITDAYPQFKGWAENRNSNLDWYEYSAEGKVCR